MRTNDLIVTKIANNESSAVNASTGQWIYILGVSSGGTGDATLTFSDDADLDVLRWGSGNASPVMLAPIRCKSFTMAHGGGVTNVSVMYTERAY